LFRGLRGALRRWLAVHGADVAWVVGLSIAGALLVASTARMDSPLSVFDEAHHIDYVDSISRGDLVTRGDAVGQVALRARACRGLGSGPPLPTCDDRVVEPDSGEPEELQYLFQHPPTYYAVTAALVPVVQALGDVQDFVLAARLVGVLWLAAGLAAAWVVGHQLGAPRLALGGILLLAISTPAAQHAAATVNNDVSALLAGAILVAVTLRWERARRGLGWLAVAGFAAGALKSTNAFAAMACGLFLLWAGVGRGAEEGSWWRRYDHRAALAGVTLVASCVAAVVLWVVVIEATATLPFEALPPQVSDIHDPTFDDHLPNVAAFVSPVRGSYVPAAIRTGLTLLFRRLLDLTLVGGVMAVALLGAVARDRALATTLLLTAVVGGVLLGFAEIVVIGRFIHIPPRYGLSLLPAFLALTALAWSRRGWAVGLALAGIGAWAYDLALILT